MNIETNKNGISQESYNKFLELVKKNSYSNSKTLKTKSCFDKVRIINLKKEIKKNKEFLYELIKIYESGLKTTPEHFWMCDTTEDINKYTEWFNIHRNLMRVILINMYKPNNERGEKDFIDVINRRYCLFPENNEISDKDKNDIISLLNGKEIDNPLRDRWIVQLSKILLVQIIAYYYLVKS